MKKLFALMLALCLLSGCAALAENELSWEQVAPALESAGITGQFYTFEEIAVAVFVPDGMDPAELPGENYIGYFAAEDGSAIAVQYVDMDDMDLDAYAAVLPEVGAAEVESGVLNGMPCVTYELPETGTLVVAFATEAGYILEVACGPAADDEAKQAAAMILASVQPYSAE